MGRKLVLFRVRSRPSKKYCARALTAVYCWFISEVKNRTGLPEEPEVACFAIPIGPLGGKRLPSLSTCLATSLRVRTGRSESATPLIFLTPTRLRQNADRLTACCKRFSNWVWTQ